MESPSLVHKRTGTRSVSHVPSSCQPNGVCSLRQTVSNGHSPASSVRGLEETSVEQQIRNLKLSVTNKRTQAGSLIDFKPNHCHSSSDVDQPCRVQTVSGLEQQISNSKLSARTARPHVSDLTNSDPDHGQLYGRLSSEMASLKDKVDQQCKVR